MYLNLPLAHLRIKDNNKILWGPSLILLQTEKCNVLFTLLVISKPLHVVFAVDISSRTTPEQISAMLDFITNTVKTFHSDHVKVAIVTYHAQSKTIRNFQKERLPTNLEEALNTIRNVNFRLSGSVRNLDTLFREIDQRVFDKASFKEEEIDDAVVVVMATGYFNPSLIGQSKKGFRRLMDERRIDVVFVDVGNEGNHHRILGPSVSNYTATHVGDLPGLFSKISLLLARKSGKAYFLQPFNLIWQNLYILYVATVLKLNTLNKLFHY